MPSDFSTPGGLDGACGGPTIRAGIVSGAVVYVALHFCSPPQLVPSLAVIFLAPYNRVSLSGNFY